MSARTRVIALGQRAAGDDGVGFAVLEELHRREIPPHVELLSASDATDLIWLLETPATVVLVDAAVGAAPGQVIAVGIADLARQSMQPVSSHGVRLTEVVALARLLAPERVARSVRVVAITIEWPDRFCTGLSPSVAAAIGRAADRVLEFAAE